MRVVSSALMLVVAASFGTAMSEAREPSVEVSEESNLLVSWDEWYDELDSTDTWPDVAADRGVLDRAEQISSYGGSLYHLVDECARRLELRSVACGEEAHAEEFRIPFMESGDLPCGFQTRMTKGTLENLASRFHFHFVGDSTTRRLAESFVSIVTGEGSTHKVYHKDRNLSSGSLQVSFHWAPYCSGEQDFPAVSTPFKNVMSKRDGEAERIGDKRAVFVTAFGIWDVEHLDVTTALSSCTEVVRWLVQEAPYSDTSAESDGGKDASSPPPPLVFIFQDNTFLPGSLKDAFLKQLHRVQLEFVESDREESHAEVYLVHDRDSLYETMSCYRRAEEVHFLEPVKLVEGKMLWDLIALVVGGDGE